MWWRDGTLTLVITLTTTTTTNADTSARIPILNIVLNNQKQWREREREREAFTSNYENFHWRGLWHEKCSFRVCAFVNVMHFGFAFDRNQLSACLIGNIGNVWLKNPLTCRISNLSMFLSHFTKDLAPWWCVVAHGIVYCTAPYITTCARTRCSCIGRQFDYINSNV